MGDANPKTLRAYLDRIGFAAEPKRDLETLRALHRLHPFAIPFENLSTLAGDPVSLEIDAIVEKLIRQRRGGYCFEQNTLLQTVLEILGFDVLPLAARVTWNRSTGHVNPRTHMVLLVSVAERQFLCDVGFGGATLTAPLEFSPGVIQETPHEPFRIRQSHQEFVLEVRLGEEWRAAYEFDLQPQQPIDYEAMNHFVQTHPSSHFRHVLMAGRPDAQGRYAIGGNELSRYEKGELVERRRLESVAALAGALREQFGIDVPSSPGLNAALESITAAAEP
jgi:N-hydroxyarylamine O-acetyltransferase